MAASELDCKPVQFRCLNWTGLTCMFAITLAPETNEVVFKNPCVHNPLGEKQFTIDVS